MTTDKKPTSELLDGINSDIKEEEKEQLWDELWSRDPFNFYNEKIAELEKNIEELRQVVYSLRKHKHFKNGEPGLPL